MGINQFVLQWPVLSQVGSVLLIMLLMIGVGEMMYQKEKREKREEKEQL